MNDVNLQNSSNNTMMEAVCIATRLCCKTAWKCSPMSIVSVKVSIVQVSENPKRNEKKKLKKERWKDVAREKFVRHHFADVKI